MPCITGYAGRGGALIAIAIGLGSVSDVTAAEAKAAASAKITYADHVRPIFREHCFNCHNQNRDAVGLGVHHCLRKGLRPGVLRGPATAPPR